MPWCAATPIGRWYERVIRGGARICGPRSPSTPVPRALRPRSGRLAAPHGVEGTSTPGRPAATRGRCEPGGTAGGKISPEPPEESAGPAPGSRSRTGCGGPTGSPTKWVGEQLGRPRRVVPRGAAYAGPRPFVSRTTTKEVTETLYRPVPHRWTCPRSSTRCWSSGTSRRPSRSRSPATRAPRWTFYEGPPTANGTPGTHHIEARVFKDVFPRFKTMQGYQVERKAGWDCHGLPVELAVEKELGFSGKHDIEAYGIAEFNARCRESVLRHVDLLEQMTERMGYWVDMGDAYWTMDPEYVESVWWALKQIYERGAARRGLPRRAVLPPLRHRAVRPRARPGLRDRHRPVGLRALPAHLGPVRRHGSPGPLLVWTTTPWTLVSNTPVAAHPDVTYVVATDGERDPRRGRAAGRARRSVRAGRSGDRFTRHRHGRWTYQRPFELVEWPARSDGTRPARRALRRPRRLRHHRGRHRPGAPVPRLRRGRHASCRATGCAMVNPIDPRATSTTTSPWSAGSSSSTPTPTWSPTSRRAGCCSATSPTSTPTRTAGAATPRCSTTPSRPGTSAPPRSRTPAAREREHQLVPRDHQVGALRRLAEQQHRLGAVPQPLLGHPAADLAVRRGPPDRASARSPSSRELTGTDQSALDPHRPVRRRHRPSPARTVRRTGRRRRVPEVIDAWFDSRLDAVRAVGLPARRGLGGDVRAGLPGRLHLRGDRPDPRLVLHADGGRHAGVRPSRRTATCCAWATSWPRTAARCPSTSATSSSRSR